MKLIYFLFAVLALIWGLSFLVTKFALILLTPIEVLAVRWLLAFILFVLLIAFKVIKVNFKGKPIKPLIWAVILQPCIYSVFESSGIDMTTASESSILIAVVPLMVLLEGRIFLKQKVSRGTVFAICISFIGVVTCIAFGPGFSTGSGIAGYLVLLGAVTSGAAYTLVINRLSKHYTSIEITFAMSAGGALFFNIASLIMGNGMRPYIVFLTDINSTMSLLFLGVGCSCIAYLIFNYNLSKLPPAIVTGVQTNAITLVGVVAGIIAGGDQWGWYTVVGLVLTATGITLSSREGKKNLN